MTADGRSVQQNLTGVWNGLYTYPNGESTSFVATLIDSGGTLTGTTHEPGTETGAVLYANLDGAHRGGALTFVKVYDGADRRRRSPIIYEGALNGDGTEIEGRWTIVGVWSGKFLMIRPGNRAVTNSRRAFTRA